MKGRETTSQSETFPSTATMGAPHFQKCLPVPRRLKCPVTYAKLLLEGHTETCSDCGSALGIQNRSFRNDAYLTTVRSIFFG